jgi:hypothetical protein
MKLVMGLVILAMLTSCMVTQECHTYDGAKGHIPSLAGASKSKPVKNHTPFYKLQRLAEK